MLFEHVRVDWRACPKNAAKDVWNQGIARRIAKTRAHTMKIKTGMRAHGRRRVCQLQHTAHDN